MFNKLLSNLPFNPSLIGQVSFYSKRLQQEASIRRLGLVFVVFAMMLQLFAIIAPPQPTLARTGNDIIPGGFNSKAAATYYCLADSYGFRTILSHFGIVCDNLAASSVQTINSRGNGGQLYSMGRLPYGKTGETPVDVPGAGTFYMRPLWSWDGGGSSNYTALVGHNVFSVPFMILFNCGNVVVIGAPQPPPPPPPPPPTPPSTPPPPVCTPETCLKLSKTARNSTRDILDANKTTANPNDTINYSLIVKNTGKATVNDFVVEENLTDVLEYANLIDLHGGSKDSKNIARWPGTDIEPGTTITKFITVKVKSKIPQTPSPASNPGSYDLVMTNVYGKTINIKVPGGVIKRTEKTIGKLPNTGPGTTIGVGFGITALTAYFFARTRLMNKELDTVKKDYASSGGV